MKLKSYAKINRTLHIGNIVQNGLCESDLHEISSLMQKIELHDELTIEDSDEFEILTDAQIPLESNLIYKAYKNLEKNISFMETPKFNLQKNIPIGYGLGGGSSNYATAIQLIVDFYKMHEKFIQNRDEILSQAFCDTSDSLFFLSGYNCAQVRKTGCEVLEPDENASNEQIIIVFPNFCTLTKYAYSYFDQNNNKLIKNKINDFDILLQLPFYRDLVSVLNEYTYEFSMCGSGAAIWILEKNIKNTEKFYNKLNDIWMLYINTSFI